MAGPYRFSLNSQDPIVLFAAMIERGIAEEAARKAKADRLAEANDRLAVALGTPVELDPNFTFQLTVGAGE